MLKQISCDLFKLNGEPRDPIAFHNGLNVVLGGNTGVNSIGKTTMMLIIDFAFGGKSYASSDAVKQLENHAIYFTFEFEGCEYHFARSTEDPSILLRVDSNQNELESVDLTEYIQWLSAQYHIDLPELSFRTAISRFFRIYGKKNYEETRPLTIGSYESQEESIDVLIKLFDLHASLIPFRKQEKIASEKIKVFRDARRFEFIPSAVDGVKKLEENNEELSRLRDNLQKLISSSESNVDKSDIEEATRANEVIRKINEARRVLNRKNDEIHLINVNIEEGVYPTEADLKSLQEFFPNVNLKRLLDIERFHSKIQTILSSELEAEKSRLLEERLPLQNIVEKLESELDSIKPSRAFSKEFLDAHSEIDRRIHKLEDENEAFRTRERLGDAKKNATARLKEQVRFVLSKIEYSINTRMGELSDYISDGKDNPPRLTLKEYNSYNFETPRDTGTGTNKKGLILYDLAVLQLTVLPAIVHDSIIFDSISDDTIRKILYLYAQTDQKQIFIAFDREDKYGAETLELLRKHMVLKLDNDGEALFGEKWSRKENTNHEDSI